MMQALCRFALFSVLSASAFGQQAHLTLGFANPGLSPAAYELLINEDGSGHYHSDPGDLATADAHGGKPQPFDQDIHVSASVRQQIFALARSHHFFAMACEAPKSKVAFNGKKTLTYAGPDGSGACTYNYSRDPQLNKLAETMFALSNTLEIGRSLRLKLLYDHLGLDAELETLSDFVKDGRAIELGNIAPELTTIDQDPSVMSRARARAHALLQNAPSE